MSDFLCGKCGGRTSLIIESEEIENDVERTYALCERCKGKTTVLYTDTAIRELMRDQRQTRTRKKRRENQKKILELQNALREKYEE